jgi:hypothetical protein
MKTYARVQDSLVMEVLNTDRSIQSLFHEALVWVAVPEGHTVAPGMSYDGKEFLFPHESARVEQAPSLHSIMATLSSIQEQLAVLKGAP